ncbi:hypothetical protein O9992_20160 [Vibrio lentus]|nr:hypothetical protein [Vibrio lentus]
MAELAAVLGVKIQPSSFCAVASIKHNRIVSVGFNGWPTYAVLIVLILIDREMKYSRHFTLKKMQSKLALNDLVDSCGLNTTSLSELCSKIIQTGFQRYIAQSKEDFLLLGR